MCNASNSMPRSTCTPRAAPLSPNTPSGTCLERNSSHHNAAASFSCGLGSFTGVQADDRVMNDALRILPSPLPTAEQPFRAYDFDSFFRARVGSAEPVVFFFQAEDGIRDVAVTGVQTCALPI